MSVRGPVRVLRVSACASARLCGFTRLCVPAPLRAPARARYIPRFCASACAPRDCGHVSAALRNSARACALVRACIILSTLSFARRPRDICAGFCAPLRVPARLCVLSAQLYASARLCAGFCAPMQVCATMRTVRASARILRFCASACASRACKRFSASHRNSARFCALLRALCAFLRACECFLRSWARLRAFARASARLCTFARLWDACARLRVFAHLCVLLRACARSLTLLRLHPPLRVSTRPTRLRALLRACACLLPPRASLRPRLHVCARVYTSERASAHFCASLRAFARQCAPSAPLRVCVPVCA